MTLKQKRFAREYVATGNATEAAARAYPDLSNRNVANAVGNENLAKPSVQSEVARIMRDSGMDMPDVIAIHRRNMEQDKHLPTSQRAVETYYQLEGIMAKAEAPKLSVAFVIHTDTTPATDTPTFKTLPQE